MEKVYNVDMCTLSVRVTNRAAYTLYHEVLGYTIKETEKEYYADGEDAYVMYMKFGEDKEESKVIENVPEGGSSFDQYAE